MGREDSFLKGFTKQANSLAKKLVKAKRMATIAAVGGGTAYGLGKILQNSEDQEQAKLRVLRKAHALPYQNN